MPRKFPPPGPVGTGGGAGTNEGSTPWVLDASSLLVLIGRCAKVVGGPFQVHPPLLFMCASSELKS